MTPDSIKFGFPRRPRPYYNMADPYLSPHDTIKDDIHALLHDTTHLIPSKDEGFHGAVTSIPREENVWSSYILGSFQIRKENWKRSRPPGWFL